MRIEYLCVCEDRGDRRVHVIRRMNVTRLSTAQREAARTGLERQLNHDRFYVCEQTRYSRDRGMQPAEHHARSTEERSDG